MKLHGRDGVRDITNYLEKPEIDAMLDAAATCSQRDYLMLRVLWRTGVRVNELRHIRPKDIEIGNGVLNVTTAKGGKQRRIPLDTETIAQLQDYVIEEGIGKDESIFPLSKQWIRGLVHHYGVLIGRDDVHPHTFRHSFAINSVRHGVDIRRLQQALGHASMSTTAVYLQFNDKDLQDVYANVVF